MSTILAPALRSDLPEGVSREVMDVDVLIVGGGAAGLSCALQVQNLVQKHNEEIAAGTKQGMAIADPMIAVLEKGPEIGAHSFSGAVLMMIVLFSCLTRQ